MQVYLNGAYVDAADAKVSVDDRGFLFADGVYEVIRVYDGRPFLAEPHIRRLREGLLAVRMEPGVADTVMPAAERLLDANELRQGDVTIYIQVTRGASPRKHAFPPAGVPPTVYIATKPFAQHPTAYFEEGVAAITVPDMRWSRCDIKSVSLLPNILANQQAKDAGAFEALFVRDGVVIEGSHSNLCAVIDGVLVTYPECNYVLGGITRRIVLEIARELDIPVREGAILLEHLEVAQELFLSGTTTEIMPVTVVDGRPVGAGEPGPITRRLLQAYRERAGLAIGVV
ncbi:MAG: D-amino acid aminotransferase [Longimicrobiales bacterium]